MTRWTLFPAALVARSVGTALAAAQTADKMAKEAMAWAGRCRHGQRGDAIDLSHVPAGKRPSTGHS